MNQRCCLIQSGLLELETIQSYSGESKRPTFSSLKAADNWNLLTLVTVAYLPDILQSLACNFKIISSLEGGRYHW